MSFGEVGERLSVVRGWGAGFVCLRLVGGSGAKRVGWGGSGAWVAWMWRAPPGPAPNGATQDEVMVGLTSGYGGAWQHAAMRARVGANLVTDDRACAMWNATRRA